MAHEPIRGRRSRFHDHRRLTPVKTGTKLTLTHRGVPDGQTSYEKHGWRDNYFEPMKAYFAAQRASEKS